MERYVQCIADGKHVRCVASIRTRTIRFVVVGVEPLISLLLNIPFGGLVYIRSMTYGDKRYTILSRKCI